MNRTLSPLLSLLLALGAGVDACAADGWFGGLLIAPWISRTDALLNLDRVEGPAAPASRKATATGAGVPGAQGAGRRVDVELGYGAAQDLADGPLGSARTPAGQAFRLSGVGTWSLGSAVGVTGRVGAYRGDVEMQNAYRLVPDASVHPTFGMGLRYDYSPNLRLQGGWDRYNPAGSLRPGDGGVDLLTIGLKYRF